MSKSRQQFCCFYIDEAGDGNIFSSKRNKVIIGNEGCSTYFMMGFLEVGDPKSLSESLDELRTELLEDPYFAGVPSMQPDKQKTAISFHANNDLPEIRREVFKLLRKREDLKFYAVVKDKRATLAAIRDKEKLDPSYRYKPNELYDQLVRKLFTNQLDRADEYQIIFAKRGKTNRTKALRTALEDAKNNSNVKIKTTSLMKVNTAKSIQYSGLQAVDYYLWSLQRLYERHEDRYFNYLWPHFRLVIDMDGDIGKVYFSQKRPLTMASLKSKPR